MNKLFKGAIASAAGVALLLGGAGTFALWKDVADFGADRAIRAGHLEFIEDGMDAAVWYLNGLEEPDITAVHLVPGDVVTMEWNDVGLRVVGKYLVAEFGVDLEGFENGLTAEQKAFYADLHPTVLLSEGEGADKVEYPHGAQVELSPGDHYFDVTARVEFDGEAKNELAYGQAIPLDGLGLTVEQVPHEVHGNN